MDGIRRSSVSGPRTARWVLLLCLLGAVTARGAAAAESAAEDATFAAWVRAMKTQLQGPYLGVRWFCADGTIQPPREYACRERGGGRQSGQRDARAEAIRAAGIPIANVLSELTPESALADDARLLKAVLVEQFLIDVDDGWILRRARYVRGMFQAEDEAAAARRILLELARDPRVTGPRFVLLREAVRLLPRPIAAGSFGEVRALADELAREDPDFVGLRNLIHSRPAVELAGRVRRHAQTAVSQTLRVRFEQLAGSIERAFAHTVLATQIDRAATALVDPELQRLAALYGQTEVADRQLDILAEILVRIREAMPGYAPSRRLLAIELSLAAEEAAFAATRTIGADATRSRRARLAALRPLVEALHGTGLLTRRERGYLLQTIEPLIEATDVSAGRYRDAIAVLARAPAWASNRMRFHFDPAVRAFTRIEPRAAGLIADRLHASPMLAFGEHLEELAADGDGVAGITHTLFGQPLSGGLRVLNPGLARGRLQRPGDVRAAADATPGIVLVPETTAELPAVAGILTESAGNAVSHVQLLARNLGLPNVVVGAQQLPALQQRLGTKIVLAASPGGVVRLDADGPQWDLWFPASGDRPPQVDIDASRLDLTLRRPLALAELRAADAGRSVGPKAANLGELAHRYPGRVSPALAIPFGVYRSVLDGTSPDGVLPMFDWLQLQHRLLQEIDDPARRAAALREFLQRTRDWFAGAAFPAGFAEALRAQTQALFGADGGYGVYVRSDTNLEDLPGFTGAGLNRTIPNVVGFDAVLDAIRTVWASPFSERAYGWRQMAMARPEHLYVSVLLHRTVASDKSGVMVTADPASGDRDWIYISANEGAGGVVDGQSAESLRVRLVDGHVDLVSSATEPTRRETLPGGGLRDVAASGEPILLSADEVRQLTALARTIAERHPQLRDDSGATTAADVEFAFAGGRLYLLQIRPFLQSARAQRSALLRQLDAALATGRDDRVDLDRPP